VRARTASVIIFSRHIRKHSEQCPVVHVTETVRSVVVGQGELVLLAQSVQDLGNITLSTLPDASETICRHLYEQGVWDRVSTGSSKTRKELPLTE
jgi:hypothetical protein